MCRAFQVATAVSVGDTVSGRRPSSAGCALTRSTTWAARSGLGAGQPASGVQSPAADAAGGKATTAAALTATRRMWTKQRDKRQSVARELASVPRGVAQRIREPDAQTDPSTGGREYATGGRERPRIGSVRR